jgi:hypothetical protein
MIAIYFCFTPDCYAENPTEAPLKMGFRAERGIVDGRLACITDPESKLALVTFLRNKSIANEIALPEKKLATLMDLLTKSKGSLLCPVYTQTLSRPGFTKDSLERFMPYFKELGQTKVGEMSDYNRQVVDSVLSESDVNRLRQLVYQVELFRVGPCKALNEGFLGKRLGIEDYQRSAIQIRYESSSRHFDEASKEVLKKAYLELGSLLSEEMAKELQQLLGAPFFFRDDTFSYNYYITLPNPESLMASVCLICNHSVAYELRVTEQERSSLEDFLRSRRGQIEFPRVESRLNGRKRTRDELKSAVDNARQQNEAFVNDILDPLQTDRLRELGYQVEIARLGISDSLTKGFLGKKLDIDPSLLPDICTKAESIFAKAHVELDKLQLQAREEVFRELSPLQRQELNTVLGKPFSFRDQVLD